MKNLRTSLLCACIALGSYAASAQTETVPVNEPNYNKPKLFQGLPDNINISIDKLNALLNTSVGKSVSTDLSKDASFQFNGEVISTVSKYEGKVQSVVIRSANYEGANLTISKIINEDGSISYKGRLISFKNADLYELQEKNGQLTLVKRNYYDLVNE
jgi:hypothetical protein